MGFSVRGSVAKSILADNRATSLVCTEDLTELRLETRDADFAGSKFGDLRIDTLLTSNPLFEQVRRQYTTSKRFVEQEIPCARRNSATSQTVSRAQVVYRSTIVLLVPLCGYV